MGAPSANNSKILTFSLFISCLKVTSFLASVSGFLKKACSLGKSCSTVCKSATANLGDTDRAERPRTRTIVTNLRASIVSLNKEILPAETPPTTASIAAITLLHKPVPFLADS